MTCAAGTQVYSRVAAVERAAHAAHHGGDLLARLELAARRGGDDAGGLDARARAGTSRPAARPSRVCSSERLRPNAFTSISTQPGLRLGDRQVADLRAPPAARGVQHDRAHRPRHRSTPSPAAASSRRAKPCICSCSPASSTGSRNADSSAAYVLARGLQDPRACRRERDPRRAPVVRVGRPREQARRHDPVDQLARPPDRDPQRRRQITDSAGFRPAPAT